MWCQHCSCVCLGEVTSGLNAEEEFPALLQNGNSQATKTLSHSIITHSLSSFLFFSLDINFKLWLMKQKTNPWGWSIRKKSPDNCARSVGDDEVGWRITSGNSVIYPVPAVLPLCRHQSYSSPLGTKRGIEAWASAPEKEGLLSQLSPNTS